jgi:hypothetical protein
LDSVLRLAQQGYLIQILNDNNIPFEITHSGRIKFERESELNASLIEEKALRKAKLKTEIDLNNKNLKGEPWYRKWEALAVIGTFVLLVLSYVSGLLQKLLQCLFP